MLSRSQTTKIQAPTQFRRASTDQPKYMDVNPSLLDEIRKCIRQEMQQFKAEIRQEIRAELQEINQSIDKLTGEISAVKHRVGTLEYRDDRLAEELEDIRKLRELDLDDRAVWEQKLREKCIKIRGLPELKNENLMETLVPKLAKFINKKEELLYTEVDRIFRLNSIVAKKKKLPRDIVVYLVKRQTRDLILKTQNDSPLIVDGNTVQILKDIPVRLLKKRKEYVFLTTLLRQQGVPYRWNSPEGLVFWWGKRRVVIKNLDEARRFWDLEERRKNQKERPRQEKDQGSKGSQPTAGKPIEGENSKDELDNLTELTVGDRLAERERKESDLGEEEVNDEEILSDPEGSLSMQDEGTDGDQDKELLEP